ncbi:hypothetical protein MJN54_32040, partial [Salmonella enterica subsp. enterica serovar Kentucky]|nr:hypothetical protein [Salmonella enterica subsp. enterica serovar Kentucky]
LLIACPNVVPPTVPVAERYFPDAVRSAKLKIYQQQWLSFYQFTWVMWVARWACKRMP